MKVHVLYRNRSLMHFFRLLILLATAKLSAQNIPLTDQVEWNQAGVQGGIPCISTNVYNFVTNYGGDATGTTDNSSKLNTALAGLPGSAVIYFPNGTYTFNSAINVPANKVIRGESTSGTIFNFTLPSGSNCFNVQGAQTATTTSVTANAAKGSNNITVASTAGFAVNDDIELQQVNNTTIVLPANQTSWATNLRGQLFVITGIAGNTITLDRTFTLDYNTADAISIYKTNLVKNVGFESFTINRLDANNGTGDETFLLQYTANSWLTCVQSTNTGRYHIYLNNTRNAEVRGCYFYKAMSYSSGGEGYGVLCQQHVGECLIENNIFRSLRHSLIVKQGASRNVYGYNYAREAQWNLAGPPAVLSIHGHYPYYNLFESNVVERITDTDAWGMAGPGNTFFRNRVFGTKDVWVQLGSNYQNFEANELTGGSTVIQGNYDGSVTGTLQVADNQNGSIDNAPAFPVLNSYYLSAKPAFFGSTPWPAIGYGTTFNTLTIPAETRWNNYVISNNIEDLMDYCNTCASNLPVQFITFVGNANNGINTLHWSTATESNSHDFTIERSTDGHQFIPIGQVPATGNSTHQENYFYTDNHIDTNLYYYRLVEHDVNGSGTYSTTILVKQNKTILFHIIRNNNDLTLTLYPTDSPLFYSVSDITGNILENGSIAPHTSEIKIGKCLASGIYILTVSNNDTRQTIKLLKD